MIYCVAVEGRESDDGRLIEEGALSWEVGDGCWDGLPLLDRQGRVVGLVRDFHREEGTGQLLASVIVDEDLMAAWEDAGGLGFEVTVDQVKFHLAGEDDHKVMVFESARIRGVRVGGSFIWPECGL